MDEATSEILARLGVMQTLVENFPLGILDQFKIKTYKSGFEFLVDCLQAININDKEIFRFILTDIIGVNFSMDDLDFGKLNEWVKNVQDEDLWDCAFLNGLDSVVKSLISLVLSEIYSCSIHPKIKRSYITDGVNCPVNTIDLTKMLDICPTTDEGKRQYNNIDESTTPSSLKDAIDLNAFIWYTLYKANQHEDQEWTNRRVGHYDMNNPGEEKTICTLSNENYLDIKLKIGEDYTGKSLYRFNKDYLDSIRIFSPKRLITGLFENLVLGLPSPNINLSYGYTDILTQAMLNKIIKNVITVDDTEVNDCFYTFTNDDWIQMMEENELSKYDARYGETQTGIGVQVNKQAVIDGLNQASSAATLYEKRDIIEKTLYDVSVTPATDGMIETKSTWELSFNENWLSNIIINLINPIVKSVLSPKVMLLIIANYEMAGLVNAANMKFDMFYFLEFIKKKLIGFLVKLIVKIKDIIIKALLRFFKNKVLPLILKWAEMRLLEQLEGYLAALLEALECVKIFDIFGHKNILTAIDDVNYADIIQTEKVIPDSDNTC